MKIKSCWCFMFSISPLRTDKYVFRGKSRTFKHLLWWTAKTLNDPCFLVFVYLGNPVYLSVAGSQDSLLMNRIWWKWCDVTSTARLPKGCDIYVTSTHPYAGTLFCPLAYMAGNQGRPLTNNLQETEASVQQPLRGWILPTTMWVNSEAKLCQLSLRMTADL